MVVEGRRQNKPASWALGGEETCFEVERRPSKGEGEAWLTTASLPAPFLASQQMGPTGHQRRSVTPNAAGDSDKSLAWRDLSSEGFYGMDMPQSQILPPCCLEYICR